VARLPVGDVNPASGGIHVMPAPFSLAVPLLAKRERPPLAGCRRMADAIIRQRTTLTRRSQLQEAALQQMRWRAVATICPEGA